MTQTVAYTLFQTLPSIQKRLKHRRVTYIRGGRYNREYNSIDVGEYVVLKTKARDLTS